MLIIESCFDCPHYHEHKGTRDYCILDMKIGMGDPAVIPDDCPLEDVEDE